MTITSLRVPASIAAIVWSPVLALAAAPAPLSRQGDALVVTGQSYRAAWSAKDGHLLGLWSVAAGRQAQRLLLESKPQWRVRFVDGAEVDSASCLKPPWNAAFSYKWDKGPATLSLVYGSPGKLAVTVQVRAQPEFLDLRGLVRSTPKTILRFDLPARARFDAHAARRVVFPQYGGLSTGLAFTRSFFLAHTSPRTRRWRRAHIGPQGYAMLFGAPLKQLADAPPAVRMKVTAEGHKWFSASQVGLIEKHPMIINRPPAPGQAALVLVDSANGPALCAASLGGKGLLLRFTGRGDLRTAEADKRSVRRMVFAACEALVRKFPERFRGRRVGLIDLDNGPPRGGWTAVSVAEWRGWLSTARFVRAGRAEFDRITTPEALADALRSSRYALILNPYGEWLPSAKGGRWRETLKALKAFVQAGGFWWETGGYPFFYELLPDQNWFAAETSQYPPATADFCHIALSDASLAAYGVQPLMARPWEGRDDPSKLLAPCELSVGGAADGGFYRHGWHAAIEPGAVWRAPALRLRPGLDAPAALADYAADIGLNRKLSEKAPAKLLAALKAAVLVRLGGGSAAEQIAGLERLPHGSLVHFTEYLRGGFDKQYPDHLPPNPSWGTAADFKRFYRRGHELGHLMMPYTNTSWWCIGPKGPTFEREGEAPLARRRDGRLIKERYSVNEGYRICFWRPAVRAADRQVVRQMTRDYPSDVLFQDQVGARGWSWDYNAAAPNRTAWISGLLSMGMEDAAHASLATENGYDRVAQFETMLCGMGWGLAPSGGKHEAMRNIHRYADGDWQPFPLLSYLAHDKAIFTLHDLGHFVFTPEQQAWVVGLGFSMSFRCSAGSLDDPANARWLFWLDAVQKTAAAAYAGQRLEAFAAARNPQEGARRTPAILASRYAGDVVVCANTGDHSLALADLPALAGSLRGPFGRDASVQIAGPGFLAGGPGWRAGWVQANPHADAYGYAIKRGPGGGDATLLAMPSSQTAVPLPAGVEVRAASVQEWFPGRGQNRGATTALKLAAAGPGLVRFRLPASAAQERTRIPAACAGKSPAAWPQRPRTIAVIAFDLPAPKSWVRVSPQDWLNALRSSAALKAAGLQVRPIRTVAELTAALKAKGAEKPFAVINPNGEYFPAPRVDAWPAQLDAIRSYVQNGGVWWETGGYSFYICEAPRLEAGRVVGWVTRPVGPAAAARLGFACAGYDVNAPAEPLRITRPGRAWFGPKRTARLSQLVSGVQRSFRGEKEDVVLVRGDLDDFVAAARLGGWGWLWRLGGFNPEPTAAREAVLGVLEYLATHPWPSARYEPERRLWRVRFLKR